MKIEVLKRISFEDLEEKIREVPLLKLALDGSNIFVYKDADISLRTVHPNEINPTTFYLLRKQMEFQRELRKYLLINHSIDPLNLNESIEIKNEKDEIWTLIPPIVEVVTRKVKYIPSEGELSYDDSHNIQIPIINDGAHRVNLARELGLKINVVFISGVTQEYPFYAHPNNWDLVKIVDEVPKTKKQKKMYLREDCYELYRNFDVLGCGKPRYTAPG